MAFVEGYFRHNPAKQPPDCPYPASVFTIHEDGTITVAQWYPRQLITARLLGEADSGMMETIIRIMVANGTATYRVIGIGNDDCVLVCELLEG